ncbi:hypothetical protein SAMN03080617_00664 [Algoriphagus alkaliphilus]|uniref:Uncharacterized protein n=1 Tax=Algoriphagus alkaliphilus TaxID=279824 RepID=A0A1G5VT50_9BACT|nr:hypothetical protein SAMN03080617_00664 [Algoriphagus alkaliphilus]
MSTQIIHYKRYFLGILKPVVGYLLVNLAQSFFIFRSVTSTFLLPVNGSDAKNVLATPQSSYSKSPLVS